MAELLLCEFCKKTFKNVSALNVHQKNTKYCLIIQGKIQPVNTVVIFDCKYCEKVLTSKQMLNVHQSICEVKIKQDNDKKESEIIKLRQENIQLLEYKEQSIKIQEDNKQQIKELQDKTERMAMKAIEKPTTTNNLIPRFETETIIEIEEDEEDEDEDEEEIENDDFQYKIIPLELNKEFSIENREEDGYINVTNLCKAGGKQFKSWNRLDKTKAFLRVLSATVNIHTSELIKMNTGGNGERHTWVHPQVAINIAQWISPQFDVKVSAWIYEVMMTGKVDITNTKSYRQLQEENKNKELKIQYLTKKYVKKQSRAEFEEKNVIYILTTPSLKKDRRYILGKAGNLTHRLSTYNKTDEHEVIYYQGCGDEETMAIVETVVFQRLKEYRERANRERFILPEDKEVDIFIDVIKKSIEFVIEK